MCNKRFLAYHSITKHAIGVFLPSRKYLLITPYVRSMLSVFRQVFFFSSFSDHQSVKSRTSKFPGREIESLTTLHCEYKRVTWSRIENALPLMYYTVCNSFHVYYYCLSWQTVEGFPPEIKRRISLYTIKIAPSDRYIAGRCKN